MAATFRHFLLASLFFSMDHGSMFSLGWRAREEPVANEGRYESCNSGTAKTHRGCVLPQDGKVSGQGDGGQSEKESVGLSTPKGNALGTQGPLIHLVGVLLFLLR